MSRCGHRLSGIHYSSAMKPMFTDKPANVSVSEHRRNITTPNGRPLECSVLHLNCKRRPIGNGGCDSDGTVRNLPCRSWYRLVVNLRRRRTGAGGPRRALLSRMSRAYAKILLNRDEYLPNGLGFGYVEIQTTLRTIKC